MNEAIYFTASISSGNAGNYPVPEETYEQQYRKFARAFYESLESQGINTDAEKVEHIKMFIPDYSLQKCPKPRQLN